MYVPAFHQAEHLASHAAHLQSLAIERAGERIQRGHDVGDGAIAVQVGVGRIGRLRLRPYAGIGLLHHLLAEVHADQIVLKNVVVEHVFGGFAQVDDPLAQIRRPDAERHVLRVVGAGGMVVAADAANAAGDEVGIARVFALHEDAVPAEDGRGAVTLDHVPVGEIDFGKDAQASDDSGYRIPIHLHDLLFLTEGFFIGNCSCAHCDRSFSAKLGSSVITSGEFGPGVPPLRFLVDGSLSYRAQRPDCTPIHDRGYR